MAIDPHKIIVAVRRPSGSFTLERNTWGQTVEREYMSPVSIEILPCGLTCIVIDGPASGSPQQSPEEGAAEYASWLASWPRLAVLSDQTTAGRCHRLGGEGKTAVVTRHDLRRWCGLPFKYDAARYAYEAYGCKTLLGLGGKLTPAGEAIVEYASWLEGYL